MGPTTWHRPLLWLAGAMGLLAMVSVGGVLVDDRTVLGANLWLKPLKFAISIAVYAVTFSWLLGQMHRMRRAAWIAGTISVVGFVVEIVIILAAALMQTTSHFNVATPVHAALWSVMAVSVVVIWSMSLVVCVALFRNGLGDPARTLAIRGGAVIAVVGMALAFLMTAPTADQLASYQGVVGAHTVGLPDGGPGLPLLGWSTVAGDLRVPHFVGMHALQALPLLVIALEVLARRWPVLGDSGVRLRLTAVAAATYAAGLLVLTWQALAGQSVVHPAGPVLVVGVGVSVGAIAAGVGVLAGARPTGPRNVDAAVAAVSPPGQPETGA